jgi:hypothetical protein
MQSEVSQDERAERAQAVQARLTRLTEVHTKLRRLDVALANLSVAPRKKQLALIASAARYVDSIEPPPGVRPLLSSVRNELRSLDEGIRAGVIPNEDILLLSGVRAIKGVEELAIKAANNIQRLKASGPLDRDEALIRKNQSLKEKIPAFNGREFVVGRAPAAFTFANTQKHSSVGYVNPDLLDQQGFKTDNLGGYTIIHNQLVIGIDAHAVYTRKVDPEGTNKRAELVRLKVKDEVIRFSGGKPRTVKQARDKKHIDLARNVLKMVERQFNTKYAFVSEQSVALNGGEFFWVMPAADLVRLARAFPGGHVKIDKWGFAF